MRRLRNCVGFTLLELLVTIVIAAVIAAIAIPAYVQYQGDAAISKMISFGQGMKPYYTRCIQKLATTTGCDLGSNGIPDFNLTKPPDVVMINDGGLPATYQITDTEGRYVIFTATPDISDGTIQTVEWSITCGNTSGVIDCP